MKIICVSDLHMNFPKKLPEGDMLLIAGDYSFQGRIEETIQFNNWLKTQPYESIIWISGNHDFLQESNPSLSKSLMDAPNTYYLHDQGLEIKGLKIYGFSWTPEFYDWAFMLKDESEEMERKTAMIPEGLDILISHGPPYGLCDKTIQGDMVGSKSLLTAISKKKPKYVVCGHIHEAYGEANWQGTTIINCSLLTHRYRLENDPVIIEINKGEEND